MHGMSFFALFTGIRVTPARLAEVNGLFFRGKQEKVRTLLRWCPTETVLPGKKAAIPEWQWRSADQQLLTYSGYNFAMAWAERLQLIIPATSLQSATESSVL